MDESPAGKSAHAGGVPSTPALRLLIVRDHAIAVLGGEPEAESWLGQTELSVLDGQCIVATACQTREGFEQAMAELARLRRLRETAEPSRAHPGEGPAAPRPAPRGGLG